MAQHDWQVGVWAESKVFFVCVCVVGVNTLVSSLAKLRVKEDVEATVT